ncbi:IS3 family transposase [Pseudonocardia sp. KRD291]|uniref:IS3 family transposase n=1 Tax=Pseudonocardia sp. KRD291 TaxID=2792007 RepID=UPI001C4A5AD3|nr:IS3 family transposase [Pseudonocardia sp. KRD291]MBW0100907.1 IS3 family transposase [Pseudonocardia sp. KRD291]
MTRRSQPPYPPELRERAVRMVAEVQADYESPWAAMNAVAEKLGVGTGETVRKWVRQAETDGGARAGTTTEESDELRRLKRENAELKRANEILKAASGFLRGRDRPATHALVRFIDQHAARSTGGRRWGVASICAQLGELGAAIAPSTYYAARAAGPSRAQQRDEELSAEVVRVHAENYGVYGARKVWTQLNREDITVARCTVERLMRAHGLVGARRGKRIRTTIAGPEVRAADLVGRRFNPPAPDQLWVADFTYVPTWSGMVYVAFVIDAYSRRILGWRAATTMRTELVLDALEQAVWTRGRQGQQDLSGLIAHSDAGSQYTSISYTERLASASVAPSVGSVGDAYDNALAESTIGLFKTELIKPRGPWRTVEQVEIATLEYVDWFNHRRLHGSAADLPPAELETAHYRHHEAQPEPEHSNR